MKDGRAKRIIRRIINEYSTMLILVMLLIVMVILRGTTFLSSRNLLNIARQEAVIGIIALGVMFPIVSAGTDLSGGSVVALCGVCVAMAARAKWAIPLIFLVAIAVGALTGIVNGYFIAYGRVPPFIATLGMMSMARGTALLLTNSKNVVGFSDAFNQIGKGNWLGVPIAVWILVVMTIIVYFILERTPFGTSVYAIGGNASAAEVSGINVRFNTAMCYVIAGICTGVASVILTSRTLSGNPSVGVSYEMDGITCVILGGASFAGGTGKVINAFFGAMILGVLVNGMTMLQIDSNMQSVVKGAVIVIAVFIDARRQKRI